MQLRFLLQPAAAAVGAGQQNASSSRHLFFAAGRATVAFGVRHCQGVGRVSSVVQTLPSAFTTTARDVSAGAAGVSVWTSR